MHRRFLGLKKMALCFRSEVAVGARDTVMPLIRKAMIVNAYIEKTSVSGRPAPVERKPMAAVAKPC